MKCLIIAEAGVNHNGNVDLAKQLIDVACEAGADFIKFQTFKTESITTKSASKADYQQRGASGSHTQYEMLKALELSESEFIEIYKYCNLKGIGFLSTAFDLESIKFLKSIGQELWKIPSGEITNYPYLVEIAKTQKPIVMSTGMSTMKEVGEAIGVLKQHGCGEITLLHCTTEYPAPYEEVNLKAMEDLRKEFHVPVGYSDHTQGVAIPIAAVALGAVVIEKHFTLDRTMAGPDHKASLEPNELKQMIESIRQVEVSLGDGVKVPTPSELKNLAVARKSIVAKKSIKKGEIFSMDNITTKRPGTGINPMRWHDVIGKEAKQSFAPDELIEL